MPINNSADTITKNLNIEFKEFYGVIEYGYSFWSRFQWNTPDFIIKEKKECYIMSRLMKN